MGWIGCVRCEKFQCDFVARTFAPVLSIFHQVLRANQTVPTALKLYETNKNMSFGSNGEDRVRSLRKILTRLRVPNFCTSLTRFRLSVVTQPNSPKCTQIVWNAQKHEFRVQWGRIGCVCFEKFWLNFVARTCAPVLPVLHRVRQPNSPKCTQIEQNTRKQEFRVQLGGLGAFDA